MPWLPTIRNSLSEPYEPTTSALSDLLTRRTLAAASSQDSLHRTTAMNEFTGAILKAQEQDLETICAALRGNARKVREGIADLPGLKMRKTPDLEGDLGVTVFLDHGTKERRDRFLRAVRAEGISALASRRLSDSAHRPANRKQGHGSPPDWPSFNTPQGKAIRYGRECCPQTIDVQERLGGVIMDPKFTDEDLNDIVKAIRKVYLAMYAT